MTPAEITLQLEPQQRFDVIDIRPRLNGEFADFLSSYRRSLYCSHHTTAGFVEQGLSARFGGRRERLQSVMGLFQQIFPPNADYTHDQMDLRDELSDEQKLTEPRNADSHLTFISAGLRNCATYDNRRSTPVYFVDLDGVHEHGSRQRRTTVLGYNDQEKVATLDLEVPVSRHSIDSINLRDPRLGLFDRLGELLRQQGISKGRVDLSLPGDERFSGLTVNEYETLLMQHDLKEVLHNPLRFMAEKSRSILRHPRVLAHKTVNYAQYDFVQVHNMLIDRLGIGGSSLEALLARFVAFVFLPAQRFVRLKRSVSLLIADREGDGRGSIVQGTYQSPILIQWRQADTGSRRLVASLYRFT